MLLVADTDGQAEDLAPGKTEGYACTECCGIGNSVSASPTVFEFRHYQFGQNTTVLSDLQHEHPI